MKLILMRHMKSGWDGMTSDHGRPLNARGHASAPLIGRWLAKHKHNPNIALVSDARRTQETFEGISEFFPKQLKTQFTRALYLSEPKEILQILAAQKYEESDTILIVAHNPGIAELAAVLVDDAPLHSKFYDYPTGATTVLEFSGEVAPQAGALIDFAVPRDL